MPIYTKGQPELVEQMQRMLHRWHPGLRDAGVKVDVVVAFAKKDEHGYPMGPAIKHHGCVVAGYVRILNLKDRVMGRGDAEIVIVGDRWPEWPVAKQNALFDHELFHLELRVDVKGAAVRDDASRPLLKIRPHDYEFGWFVVIAERHGDMSFERVQAEKIFTQAGQLLFPFAAGVSRVERAEAFLAGGKNEKAGEGRALLPINARKIKRATKELAGGSRSMPPG